MVTAVDPGHAPDRTCFQSTSDCLTGLVSAVARAALRVFQAIGNFFVYLFTSVYNCLTCSRSVEDQTSSYPSASSFQRAPAAPARARALAVAAPAAPARAREAAAAAPAADPAAVPAAPARAIVPNRRVELNQDLISINGAAELLQGIIAGGERSTEAMVETVYTAFVELHNEGQLNRASVALGYQYLFQVVGELTVQEQHDLMDGVLEALVDMRFLPREDRAHCDRLFFPQEAARRQRDQRVAALIADGRVPVGVSRVSQEAIDLTRDCRMSNYAKVTSPPVPTTVPLPAGVSNIAMDGLSAQYNRLVVGREGLTADQIRKVINFANNRSDDGYGHPNADYTTSYQHMMRLFIYELGRSAADIRRDSETPPPPPLPADEAAEAEHARDELKWGALLSACSFTDGGGCTPRRLEDLSAQVDLLRSGRRMLQDAAIFWIRTGKEEALFKELGTRDEAAGLDGISYHVMHYVNYARLHIGREWGLSQDPAMLNDPHIGFGEARARLYRGYLERSFTTAVMLQILYDRLCNPDHRALFHAQVQGMDGRNELPDDWEGTFYQPDGLTPSMLGVKQVLLNMRFLDAVQA